MRIPVKKSYIKELRPTEIQVLYNIISAEVTRNSMRLLNDGTTISESDLQKDLQKDFGLDSLTRYEILYHVEEHFNIRIDEKDFVNQQKITKVEDAINYVAPMIIAARPKQK